MIYSIFDPKKCYILSNYLKCKFDDFEVENFLCKSRAVKNGILRRNYNKYPFELTIYYFVVIFSLPVLKVVININILLYKIVAIIMQCYPTFESIFVYVHIYFYSWNSVLHMKMIFGNLILFTFLFIQ